MVGFIEGAALLNGLSDVARNIAGITKRAVGIADPEVVAELNVQAADLVQRIFDLQERMSAMQQEKTTLVDRIAQLERENAELREFNTAAENYTLKELAPHAYAYTAKAASGAAEPAVHLCVHCFDRKQKSVLQFESYEPNTFLLRCPACKNAVHQTRGDPASAGVTVGRVRRSSIFDDV